MYISNENPTLVDVYFDDVVMTHTKSNVIQYNEYYPFGMNTANSWTRENVTGNNFLFNGGTELNTTSSVYDLYFRNYDPVLGRMNQIDPMATSFAGLSPYNFSFNDPVTYNDPLGDCPTCPKYQRSDDTWWVADRRTLYGSKYSGHSSLEDWLYNNQGSMYPSTDPWAWTGMSGGDIYGASLDGLFLGRGHYADVALDFDKNGQFGYWIVGGIPSRFILRNGVKYEVISAGVQATFVPLDKTTKSEDTKLKTIGYFAGYTESAYGIWASNYDHIKYPTTKGRMKPIYKPDGSYRSQRAAQFAIYSKSVKGVGLGLSIASLAVGGYQIRQQLKNGQPVDVVNATQVGVGTVGLLASSLNAAGIGVRFTAPISASAGIFGMILTIPDSWYNVYKGAYDLQYVSTPYYPSDAEVFGGN